MRIKVRWRVASCMYAWSIRSILSSLDLSLPHYCPFPLTPLLIFHLSHLSLFLTIPPDSASPVFCLALSSSLSPIPLISLHQPKVSPILPPSYISLLSIQLFSLQIANHSFPSLPLVFSTPSLPPFLSLCLSLLTIVCRRW